MMGKDYMSCAIINVKRVIYSLCFLKNVKLALFLALNFLVFPKLSFAQNNGLHFYGQETVQDKRTSLDLSVEGDFCFNGDFELSFDLSFTPKYRDYYGYVFRIIDENGYNIDLIYDQKSSNNQNFKLIIGDKFSNIAFNLNKNFLFNKWNHFRMAYSKMEDKLLFNNGYQTFSDKNVGLKKSRCFKFLFGANHYKRFKTTDVPTMNIKDIQLLENEKVKFFWPLDEIRGDVAIDRIQQKKAKAENPLWINEMHSKWKMIKRFSVKGHPSTAFSQEKGTIYIVGPKALYSYVIGGNKLDTTIYEAGRDLTAGNQSIYDPLSDKLYNVFIDQKSATYFDFSTQHWDQHFQRPTRLTRYWHANKFISKTDSSLYIFGGYGQLIYKDSIQRYDLKNKIWSQVKIKGDVFKPRYLAALGATEDGETAYIIGGYGSVTGQQMLNPENYYDLVQFKVKSHTLKKIHTLKSPDNDFAFASSLIIDSSSKHFYGLVFPNNKFDSHLQLIRGSLTSPDYQLIGNYIPYLFHDIHSYSDLYWSPTTKKLIAVTLFTRENDQTEVKIYAIEFPPNAHKNRSEKDHSLISILFAALICMIILLAVLYYKRIKRERTILKQLNNDKGGTDTNIQLGEPGVKPVMASIDIDAPEVHQMSIYLFGNMQLFDSSGIEITKMLSPLLKELFLLILLYSMRKEGGISPKKLDELLWYGKSEKIARNNRSVNIAKLKNILDKLEYCKLNKDFGYWTIDVDHNHVYVDYFQYLQILKDQVRNDKQRIADLLKIIQRGPLLLNIEYDWLDNFKSEISHEVIDLFLRFARSANSISDPEFIIQIANHIFYFDPVNEDAVMLKCKALANLGKHTLAKNTFEKFLKDFKAIYGVEFEKSFQSIIA